MKLKVNRLITSTCIAATIMLVGCSSASKHMQDVNDNTKDRITVGKVQREISVGMSSAQVVETLGSPNIVSTDDERRESWVYDKIATQTAYSSSSGGVSTLILGFAGNIGGGIAPGVSRSAGASSTSQRTLTVIVKFDKQQKVRDFAYHTSSF